MSCSSHVYLKVRTRKTATLLLLVVELEDTSREMWESPPPVSKAAAKLSNVAVELLASSGCVAGAGCSNMIVGLRVEEQFRVFQTTTRCNMGLCGVKPTAMPALRWEGRRSFPAIHVTLLTSGLTRSVVVIDSFRVAGRPRCAGL